MHTQIAVTCALLLVAGIAGPVSAADPRDCTVYVFLDVNRRPVKTRHREVVPPAQRRALVTYKDCRVRIDEERALKAAAAAAAPGAAALLERGESEETGRQLAAGVAAWMRSFAKKIQGRMIWFVLILFIMLGAIIGVLIAGFRAGVLWGLLNLVGVLFFPPLILVFVVLHWDVAKVPFLSYLFAWAAGVALIVF